MSFDCLRISQYSNNFFIYNFIVFFFFDFKTWLIVFGQPFIEQALEGRGLDGSAPLISGVVSAVMMVLSVAASLYAARLRAWLGLAMILLLAFGMQIALAGILALTSNVIAIGFLFLRMVPNALSQPFIAATIQPMLSDASRATYISLRSLCGRLLFAASLYAVSALASSAGEMEYPQIQMILGWYALVGLILLTALGLAALSVSLEQGNDDH